MTEKNPHNRTRSRTATWKRTSHFTDVNNMKQTKLFTLAWHSCIFILSILLQNDTFIMKMLIKSLSCLSEVVLVFFFSHASHITAETFQTEVVAD